MDIHEIASYRLNNQHLLGNSFQTPAEVVAWFGAVQAQEYALAKWGVSQRLSGFSDADIETAFAEGQILRTHTMRPTWHFVTPEDIRWILKLTSPRVQAFNAYMYRQTEVDEAIFTRSIDAFIKALQGGKQLTRNELADALEKVGIQAKGTRLACIVMYAELEAFICSGARKGKQFTYALLDERVPQGKILARDEALAELVRKFFRSHGPASLHDFSWWSGLTIADSKEGIASLGDELIEESIEGKSYWHTGTLPTIMPASPSALLLPPYDEYGIAYKDSTGILEPQFIEHAKNTIFGGVIVIDGQIIGYWRRTINKKTVQMEFNPFRPMSEAEFEAAKIEAEKFGDFLGLPVAVIVI